jgi:hypothetical protein
MLCCCFCVAFVVVRCAFAAAVELPEFVLSASATFVAAFDVVVVSFELLPKSLPNVRFSTAPPPLPPAAAPPPPPPPPPPAANSFALATLCNEEFSPPCAIKLRDMRCCCWFATLRCVPTAKRQQMLSIFGTKTPKTSSVLDGDDRTRLYIKGALWKKGLKNERLKPRWFALNFAELLVRYYDIGKYWLVKGTSHRTRFRINKIFLFFVFFLGHVGAKA